MVRVNKNTHVYILSVW